MIKKRIVFFGIKYFPSKGGTSRVVENLLWGLKDSYDITIYCYKNDLASQNIPRVKTIEFSEIPIKGIGVFLYYLKCCIHLMIWGKYDLVHVHKTDAASFIPILQSKFKVVATSHAIPHLNDKWSKIGKSYFRLTESIFMRSRGIVTSISKSQVAYYSNKYGRTVKFIPNGIKISKIEQTGHAAGILKKHNVSSKYILFAARRVIPLKGCHTLIMALDQLGFKGTLIISGDIHQLPAYTERLRQDASKINVKFIGYIADQNILNDLIKGADFFVFPSEIEGMSMMLLEVALNGTPMICSNIPENKDVFDEDEVLYFESKNVDDLSEKIQFAYENNEQMHIMAIKAKNRIEKEYNIEHVIEQYSELYNQIILQP